MFDYTAPQQRQQRQHPSRTFEEIVAEVEMEQTLARWREEMEQEQAREQAREAKVAAAAAPAATAGRGALALAWGHLGGACRAMTASGVLSVLAVVSSALVLLVMLSGCAAASGGGGSVSRNDVGYPTDLQACKAAYVGIVQTELLDATSEDDLAERLGALDPWAIVPCSGLSSAQRAEIKELATAELTPLITARALEWNVL